MAMLAEPRRKVRYTVNPTGRDWRQNGDSSQFGQRMLHSMGWQEGLGLGKSNQGALEPIRVRQKNDQRGVGCSGAYAAESMPQSDDFASLLSQLNEEHSGAVGEDPGSRQAVSLEAKSRASKARLHYHRFTRGKDVSAYSSQALACIFGTKAAQMKEGLADEAVKVTPDEDDEEEISASFGFGFGGLSQQTLPHSNSESCLTDAAQQPPEIGRNGLHLVQSQTSLQDYFRAKMMERKLKQQQQQHPVAQPEIQLEPEQADSQSSWTSESSCSAASTLSDADEPIASREPCQSEPPSKRVCFSMSPKPLDDDSSDNGMPVLDFRLFPGSDMQRVLGYPHY